MVRPMLRARGKVRGFVTYRDDAGVIRGIPTGTFFTVEREPAATGYVLTWRRLDGKPAEAHLSDEEFTRLAGYRDIVLESVERGQG